MHQNPEKGESGTLWHGICRLNKILFKNSGNTLIIKYYKMKKTSLHTSKILKKFLEFGE